jgi:NAD(P) transhydrogenase subunit alpha
MDIVFCSALVPGSQAPLLLTEDMVARLQPGSVVIDVSIDQGGNCALTVPGETVLNHDVTIIGIKNIPGLLPASATWLFANNVAKLLHYMTDNKIFRIDRQDEIIASALTTCDGRIVHAAALEVMASRGVKVT